MVQMFEWGGNPKLAEYDTCDAYTTQYQYIGTGYFIYANITKTSASSGSVPTFAFFIKDENDNYTQISNVVSLNQNVERICKCTDLVYGDIYTHKISGANFTPASFHAYYLLK